ncbi:MAG: hypothetical protein H9W81_10140 [Enterococcus sp.]|nr:hypothetical protein [Enterococcus sp.]
MLSTKTKIYKELAEIHSREESLQASLKLLQNMTPEQELAFELHEYNCRRGDNCKFRYEMAWSFGEHKHWMDKAVKVSQFAEARHILAILHITQDNN